MICAADFLAFRMLVFGSDSFSFLTENLSGKVGQLFLSGKWQPWMKLALAGKGNVEVLNFKWTNAFSTIWWLSSVSLYKSLCNVNDYFTVLLLLTAAWTLQLVSSMWFRWCIIKLYLAFRIYFCVLFSHLNNYNLNNTYLLVVFMKVIMVCRSSKVYKIDFFNFTSRWFAFL